MTYLLNEISRDQEPQKTGDFCSVRGLYIKSQDADNGVGYFTSMGKELAEEFLRTL